jgi:hypothetical protein
MKTSENLCQIMAMLVFVESETIDFKSDVGICLVSSGSSVVNVCCTLLSEPYFVRKVQLLRKS